MLFAGKLYCFKSSRKLIQHAVSIFQDYWKSRGGGGGAGVPCRFEQSWESMRRRFTIYSIFLDIKKIIFLYKEINPISWYQFWFKEIYFLISKNRFLISRIGLIFYISRNRIGFFYIIDFFHIKKWIFFYIKNRFLISRNTEWIVKRHLSAPFYYLFDIFFNS